ncbi:MAG: hypothetical protein ACLTSX_03280 [Collinsella sp.]
MLDEVSREADHERLDPWFTPGAPAAVGTISELALGAEIGSVVELRSCIPVHNAPCMRELAARGARQHGSHPSSPSPRSNVSPRSAAK